MEPHLKQYYRDDHGTIHREQPVPATPQLVERAFTLELVPYIGNRSRNKNRPGGRFSITATIRREIVKTAKAETEVAPTE